MRTQRTPRLAPEVRRRELIEATLQVAEQRGWGAVTIDAVARMAGVSRPVVYDLFGDLHGLLGATLADTFDRALDGIDAALPAGPPTSEPDVVLERAFEAFLTAVRGDPLIWRLILLPPHGAPPEMRAAVERHRAALVERVASLVAWGLSRLGAPPAIDPVLLSRLLIAAGEEMGRLVLERPRRYAPARVGRSVGALARLIGPAPGGAAVARMPPPTPEPLTPPAPAGRMSRQQRSEQLLDVALELIATQGYHGISLRAIADAAGVSTPIVYRSYRNLPALLLALFRREQGRAEAALARIVPPEPVSHPPGRPPEQILLDSLTGILDAAAAHPLTWRLVLFPPESTPAPVRLLVERRRASLTRRARGLVRWGAGYLATGETQDEDILARLIVVWAQEQARMLLSDEARSRDELVAFSRALLGAVRWRSDRATVS